MRAAPTAPFALNGGRICAAMYTCRVKRSRILGIVLFGVVVLAAVGVVMDWKAILLKVEDWRQGLWAVSDGEGSLLDERIMLADKAKDKWQLGEVSVTRRVDSDGFDLFTFTKDNQSVFVGSSQKADGSLRAYVSYLDLSSGFSRSVTPQIFEMSLADSPLPKTLPGKAGEVLDSVRGIAKEARHVRFWPRALAPAKKAIDSIAQGKLRLKAPLAATSQLSGYVNYDDEEVLQLFGSCNIWQDRCVFEPYFIPLIELKPDKNTVYSSDSATAKEAWENAGNDLWRRVLLSRIFPESTRQTGERCKKAYEWWSTGKYELAPEMSREDGDEYASPWQHTEASASDSSQRTPSYEGISPAKIGGVSVASYKGKARSYVKLDYEGKTILWRMYQGGGTLETSEKLLNSTVVHTRTSQDYPAIRMKANSAIANADVRTMRAFADKMLSVKFSEWPDADWSRLLHKDMEALRAGRYWLSYSNNDSCTIIAQQVYEGEKVYSVAYADASTSQVNPGVRIELMADADGFSVYDPKNGCLLEVGKEAKLTQNPEDITAGKSLNVSAAKALFEYVETGKDKLAPELAASLSKALAFFTNPALPKPVPGEVSPPAWSYSAERAARVAATK